MNVNEKLHFINVVDVVDGFHFYYNDNKDVKLADAEIFDIDNSTNFES
jgi:hypothetical protein